MPRTLPLTVLFAFLVGCETQEALTSNDNQGPELSVEPRSSHARFALSAKVPAPI
jgi:hypothetical protein